MGGGAVRQVISASRRTDIPLYYPHWLARTLEQGYALVPQPYGGPPRWVEVGPEAVHSIVLWSKGYRRVLANEGGVRDALTAYHQLYCHLTITGLGGTSLEPNAPPWEETVRELPALVALVGDARRVSVRFDPILHWYEGEEVCGNLSHATGILTRAADAGVGTIITSFATLYAKVRRRGWRWHDPLQPERLEIAAKLAELARSLELTLRTCSDGSLTQAGAQPSCCIDGTLLSRLHPRGRQAPLAKDPGQRRECGCTISVDIGSYRMRCPNGCRYCYANPKIGGNN
jgi:hypothetical protein